MAGNFECSGNEHYRLLCVCVACLMITMRVYLKLRNLLTVKVQVGQNCQQKLNHSGHAVLKIINTGYTATEVEEQVLVKAKIIIIKLKLLTIIILFFLINFLIVIIIIIMIMTINKIIELIIMKKGGAVFLPVTGPADPVAGTLGAWPTAPLPVPSVGMEGKLGKSSVTVSINLYGNDCVCMSGTIDE